MYVTLYDFFKSNAESITEDWYARLGMHKGGVYGTEDPDEIATLKEQNLRFHHIFIELFNDESVLEDETFQRWLDEVTSDEAHLNTLLPEVVEEFLNNQQIYLDYLHTYLQHHGDDFTLNDYQTYIQKITDTFQRVVVLYSKKSQQKSKQFILAQTELINELSSPVIQLNHDISLLPLVGEINTERAKVIVSNTIKFCAEYEVTCLLVDLSGVSHIDTMVASQLSELIQGLRLIGTRTSLSGIRPEIAQTAVQLGIKFTSYNIYPSIAQALANLDFTTIDV
ncbi:STAS domain-containing protein [Alkalicoccobacillus gibsonii]|uniref:STAS domain-containing protein n=1 Tax=Alkalicoccobacillus gibsonii TaxID=79881 RepID=UPI003F7BE06E